MELDLKAFLSQYGDALKEKVINVYNPLYNPNNRDTWDNETELKLSDLKRQPFPAQVDAILALAKGFYVNGKRGLILNGEMGTGKTISAIAVAHLIPKANYRVLIMCPGHLVQKWIREIQSTIPRCRVINLNGRGLKEMEELRYAGKPACPEFYVIGKERAKNHHQWRPGIVNLKHLDEIRCPECGTILDDLKGKRPKCPKCEEPLYQADKDGFRRYAKAEYAKKYLKGIFDLFVADEIHELKGGTTAQGQALANFACIAKRTLALTGTLMGGYSTNLFYLFWRLLARKIKDRRISYYSPMSFAERYGIVERTQVEKKNSSYNNASIGKSSKTRTIIKEKPGVSPLILTDFLLENTVFMRLSDVSDALPPYDEKVVEVSMTDEQSEAYKGLETDLYAEARQALARGDHSLLGALINSLLAYPDGARRGETVFHPHRGDLIAEAPQINDRILPKEAELLDILDNELSEGRRCLICLEHTGTRDLIPDLENRILERGHSPLILRSNTVSVEKREAWVKDKMSSGEYNVMIANPNLIKTGLDLIEFPTLIFFQTGYSIYTLRQASRRSWRIGQDMPVRVYYMSYGETMQSVALSLIATKLETALAIEGDLSDRGLTCLAEGSNSMLIEMARSLMNGGETQPVSDAWKSYRKTEITSDSFLGDDVPEKETITTHISRSDRSATVTYERVIRGRIYPRKDHAVAYVNGNKFFFRKGTIIYCDKPVGKYGKDGMGNINKKPIQIVKVPKDNKYILVELRG